MAGANVSPENGNNNKRSYVMGDDPRVVHLEGRMDRFEADISDLKAGVRKLLERPQFAGFSQVAAGVLTTLLIVGVVCGLNEWRLLVATGPVETELERVRVESAKTIDSLHAAELRAAVMEERMQWVREQRARTP